MTAYRTSIPIGENSHATLCYSLSSEGEMRLTITDHNKSCSKSFYRSGKDEETMRSELLQASGVERTIQENREEITNRLRDTHLWESKDFRKKWGFYNN